MTKILITGAGGFIGAALYAHLTELGHVTYGTTTGSEADSPLMTCDITDRAAVAALIAGLSPDIIIHCAAISSVTAGKTLDYYRVNTVGTENIVEESSKLPHRVRFIFLSTAGVYGNQATEILTETLEPKPVHHYGMSKFCCERLMANFTDTIDYTIIRPFNVIGEHQNREFILPKLVNAFTHNEATIKLGNLDVYRDYIDIHDAAELITDIMHSAACYGEVVNLCSGHPTSLRDLIEALQQLAGYQIDVVVAEEFVRKNEVWRLLGDRSKLERLLGKPHTFRSLDQSLERILAYYVATQP